LSQIFTAPHSVIPSCCQYHGTAALRPTVVFSGSQRELTRNIVARSELTSPAGVHPPALASCPTPRRLPGPGKSPHAGRFDLQRHLPVTNSPIHSSYDALPVPCSTVSINHSSAASAAHRIFFTYGNHRQRVAIRQHKARVAATPLGRYNRRAIRRLSAFDFPAAGLVNSLLLSGPSARQSNSSAERAEAVDLSCAAGISALFGLLQAASRLSATCSAGAVQNGGDRPRGMPPGLNPTLPARPASAKPLSTSAAFR